MFNTRRVSRLLPPLQTIPSLVFTSRFSKDYTMSHRVVAATVDEVDVGGGGGGTGIFMMNLGGPSTCSEVEPFLNRLLSDGEIIKIPFQKYSAPLIAKRRAKIVRKQYESIGGGSPIRHWTHKQGSLMCQRLDSVHPSTAPHRHYIGFRYADPLTYESLSQMKSDGVRRAVAFSQYPQYSCSTTGSSLNELYRQLKEHDMLNHFEWSVIDRWPTHDLLAKAFADLVRRELREGFTEEERSHVVLLFSAHSLPLSVVNRGDAYPYEVAATVRKVMEELNFSHPFKIVWQSKVGPTRWLQPSTGSAMEGLAQKGFRLQLLIPIAFTSDHIETLYEYDIMYAELAKQKNIKMRRAKALNDEPLFIDALVDIVCSHFKDQQRHSIQLRLRCADCTNPHCEEMKSYFTQKNN